MSIDTQKTTKGIVVSLINKVFSKGIKLWEHDNQLKMKAPKGSLTNELREELVENKQEIISFLQQITTTDNIQKISHVDKSNVDFLPLSFAQERLWFINQLEPDSANYNISGAFILNFPVEINLLEHAFNLIIARHDNLRTVFPSQDGQARQLICDNVDFKLKFTDLSHYKTHQTRLNKAKVLCNNEANFSFELALGPLFRGQLIKLTEDQHIIMLNMHHIISDGWSMGVLVNELSIILDNLYQGKGVKLPSLPIQYADYSMWQRQLFEEEGILEKQLAYWEQKLSGVPESLDLGTDFLRAGVQSFAGATQSFAIESGLTAQIKKLTEQQGATLFMSLLAIFKVLLHRYTDKEDICIGSPIANRQYEETECLIGMFVNTLALRNQVVEDDTFTTLLAKVKRTCLEAYEHQDTPFEKIVERLHVKRNLAISPLFQIMVILQNTPMETSEAPIQEFLLDNSISQFDLTLQFTETAEGISGSIQYNTSLYMPETIKRLIGHFINLCHTIVDTPDAKISVLDYISEPEKNRLITEFNTTKSDYPKDKCVHQLFIEQVKSNPEKIAISFQSEQLNYQQLYDKSSQLALYLQSQGVKPDSLVGLFVERSVDMMVGILGILQAGGAYVPLDPDYPDDRLAYA